MKITCLIPVTFPLVFLLFYSILFCYIIFYSFFILLDFLWPGNACYHDDLHSCSLSIQRSFLYSQCGRPKQAWGLWPQFCYSFYQEIDPSTYFRWIVDDQNMLEASDLHSCPPSVQRPVISAPFYDTSRMSLNILINLAAYIFYSKIF
jgi:hypothetical protein